MKQNDEVGYRAALERLAAVYPKAEYWNDLISRVTRQPGFSSRLSLDAARLSLAVGTLTTTEINMSITLKWPCKPACPARPERWLKGVSPQAC